MKTLAKLTLLAVGLAAALPFVQAADPAPAAPTVKHPRLHALMQRRAVRQRIAHRLGLSQDQVAQLKAARAKTVAAVQAIRGDATLSADQKKAKVRETVQAARTEMRGVLTTDQRQKLDQLKKRLRHLRRLG
jgi:Spy/CpxP family protein refolding chaperone